MSSGFGPSHNMRIGGKLRVILTVNGYMKRMPMQLDCGDPNRSVPAVRHVDGARTCRYFGERTNPTGGFRQ